MSCGCGRSPTGRCVGWHNLTEEQYLEKKAQYEAKQKEKETYVERSTDTSGKATR